MDTRKIEKLAPQVVLEQVWKKVKKEWIFAFITAFVCGMLTHLYMFTNNLLTWDGVWSLYEPLEFTGFARPFLIYVTGMSTNFNLPMVLGTISMVFLSLSAAVLTELFQLQNKICILLLSLLTVTFPAVAGTFAYLYTADGYMIALFLSILAVILAEKKKKWPILGAIFLAVSLGIYQAYLSVTMTLCILLLLLQLAEGKAIKDLFRKVLVYAGMGLGGYVIYTIAVKVMIFVKGIELSGYSGTDRVTGIVFSEIPAGIVEAYRSFLSFGFRGNVLTTNLFMQVSFYALLFLAILLYITAYKKMQKKEVMIRFSIALILVAGIPLAATIFCVIAPELFVHVAMRMCWVLYFIFILVLLERYSKRAWIQWSCLILTGVMAYNFYLVSNIVYFNMNEKYEKSYALAVRLADRIEQTEGYYPWIKTVVVGTDPDYHKYPTTEVSKDILSGYYAARGDFFLNNTSKYIEVLSHYLCISLAEVTKEEEASIAAREDVAAMDTFPAADSVQIIDGILVIKMGAE